MTFSSLATAVAFLTRLPVPGMDKVDMTTTIPGSLRWFPVVGLLLGTLAALPALWLPPALAGAVYVILLLWLTRGLHWDGLADICDACGANVASVANVAPVANVACGTSATDDAARVEALHQRFGAVLKDSRLGAFGAMGLVCGMGLQGVLASLGAWESLVLAPVAGRCLPALMQLAAPPRKNSTLAKLYAPGASWMVALCHTGLAVAVALWVMGSARSVIFVLLVAGIFWWLRRLALRTGGMNGDFFGTGILCTEIAFLLAAQIRL